MGRVGNIEWDELFTKSEVADLLRVSVRTLDRWAAAGEGPRETRLGQTVRYAESDVKRWMESRKARVEVA
jgi:excisionase family DNA binding protein